MLLRFLLISIFLFALCDLLTGQRPMETTQDIRFDPFTGTVYSIPLEERPIDPAFVPHVEEMGGLKKEGGWVSKKIADGYSERVLDYPKIGDITLDRIHVPETSIEYGSFPGVKQKSRFCMILYSTMYIERKGCYEFSLSSDDGSLLWVDQVEVVNNDGGHQMRMVRDSVALTEGEYGVKLWYFQGLPDRLGLLFDAKRVGEMSACDSLERIQQYVFNSTLLFNTGASILTDTAKMVLNRFLQTLPRQRLDTIEIIGHTDAVGSNASNQILSQKRADAIAKQFQLYFQDTEIIINPIGKGETLPVSTNDTETGRAENRRVEINVMLKRG